ncbi:hypothetical protein HPB48_007572 [Haemaphysalis longicornis]|uniref:Uncharacterized protein n=1 Tax=Haemaphysalis longicornis TaxID=44386 RepID=A0A9J6FCS7_HAELO|nr:hypothetical protein HPB48_007572 [Haemaphysalis longicornis]
MQHKSELRTPSGTGMPTASGAFVASGVAPDIAGSLVPDIKNNFPATISSGNSENHGTKSHEAAATAPKPAKRARTAEPSLRPLIEHGYAQSIQKLGNSDQKKLNQYLRRENNKPLANTLTKKDECQSRNPSALSLPGPHTSKLNRGPCPTLGCNGKGHVSSLHLYHRSLPGCPKAAEALNKMPAFYKPNSKCPTPGCDGKGHVCSDRYRHWSLAGCPIAASRAAHAADGNSEHCPPVPPAELRGELREGARAITIQAPDKSRPRLLRRMQACRAHVCSMQVHHSHPDGAAPFCSCSRSATNSGTRSNQATSGGPAAAKPAGRHQPAVPNHA